MDNKVISNWIRQSRYRAKSSGIVNDLWLQDIQKIITHFDGNCAICDSEAEVLDHLFPLRSGAPNTAANVMPICQTCKKIKKGNDIVWLFNKGYLGQQKYLTILEFMLEQSGGDLIRECVRRATGIAQ